MQQDICPKCNQPIKDGEFTIGWGGASVNGQTEAHVNCPPVVEKPAVESPAPAQTATTDSPEMSHNPYIRLAARVGQ